MEKSNKEIILKLTDNFMKQPQEQVCKMLACMLIDLNRIVNYKQLEKQELDNLQYRIGWNIKQLYEFVENGPNGHLILDIKE